MMRRNFMNLLIPYLSLPVALLAIGCATNPNPLPITQTATQTTNTPGGNSSCIGTCIPYLRLNPWYAGLKPGASTTFSATVYYLSGSAVTWAVREGSAGGDITDAGVYTAPLTEGVYHVTATSKDNSTLSQTATIAVTATEFTLSGSMSTLRYWHTASLLSGGLVFIAGGENDDYDFADPAEFYDPTTGTFHPAGNVTRFQHTATVLANGDLLLAGGYGLPGGNYGLANTADLLKVGSNVIQPTGSMTNPRAGHSATLLQNGRVLFSGGLKDNTKATQTAELYDPASGKFTAAGDMTTPRSFHSAALLPNGTVLIMAGGAPGAELYDPATNSFHPGPGIAVNRCRTTTAPLADGRVLIAGGTDCSNTYLDTAEIYDPSTGQSTPTGNLVTPQSFNTATLLPDGRVLLVGGSVPNLSQFYNPATGSFTFGPHLIYPAFENTATLLPDGTVLIVGGDSPYAELYK